METKIYLKGLKARRISAGLSQKELAGKLEVMQPAVAGWESGARVPSAALLPELACVLGCSIDELYVDPEVAAS